MYKYCKVLMLSLGVRWWNKIIIKNVILLLVFYHNYFLQPAALRVKILLDRHLATNSFGLGRLFLQIKSPASKF